MRLLGTEVRGVTSGSKTLKDAINDAIRDWVTHVRHTHYLLGSALGPHPYPTIVRDFQERDRPRGVAADVRPGGQAGAGCPTRSWPVWAAAAMRLGYFTRFWSTPVCG
jgi:hypothetical protein